MEFLLWHGATHLILLSLFFNIIRSMYDELPQKESKPKPLSTLKRCRIVHKYLGVGFFWGAHEWCLVWARGILIDAFLGK